MALASCYRKSLLIAAQLGCRSIAFPLISTGTYGFPKDKALDIALKTIEQLLQNSDMEVILVVFDRKAFVLSENLTARVRQYIDENYVSAQAREEYGSDLRGASPESERRRRLHHERGYSAYRTIESPVPEEDALPQSGVPHKKALFQKEKAPSLDDVLSAKQDNFHDMLFRLIDRKGMKDTEVWHRANISHKLFSKIKCNENYTPSKKTALALSIALELNLDQTVDLLGRAGLALSPSSISDLIIRYCIQNGIYNMFEIDALLFDNGQPTIGSDE